MNNHIWDVIRYELIRNLQRKGYLFATFGVPLIGFVIFMIMQSVVGSSSEEQIEQLEFEIKGITAAGYVDNSGLFPEPGPYAEHVMIPFDTETAAHDALTAGDLDVYYVIFEDYLETGDVLMVAPRFSANHVINAVTPIESLFYGQWAEDVDIATLIRLREPTVIEQIEFEQDSEEGVNRDEDADFVIIYGFTIIFMIALFGTNGYLMQSVIEEKETRLIEILISSVRPSQLLAGKILAMSVLGLLQVTMYITAGIIFAQIAADSSALIDTFASNIEIPYEKLPLLFIYFVLAYSFFAAGFGAVGALASSMSEGPNLALFFVLPSILPFYFLSIFIEDPNGTIPVILSIFPITAPISMVMRVSITSVPIIQIALSLTLLTLMVLGMFWLAGRLFQMHTLLAGTPPKFKDIPKLLRGS